MRYIFFSLCIISAVFNPAMLYSSDCLGTGDISANLAPFNSTGGIGVTVTGNDVVVFADVAMTGGTYNFRNFTINPGIRVAVVGSAPLQIFCTGSCTISGILDLSGKDGAVSNNRCAIGATAPAAAGGAGGGGGGAAGGNGGGSTTSATAGFPGSSFGSFSGRGLGGNIPTTSGLGGGGGGGGGASYGAAGTFGTNGSVGDFTAGGSGGGIGNIYGDPSITTTFNGSVLLGGSGGGGGGGASGNPSRSSGAGGGGGGGAVGINAQAINLAGGLITVKGGNGGSGSAPANCSSHQGRYAAGGGGGGGSGGTVLLKYLTACTSCAVGNNVNISGGTGGTGNAWSGSTGGNGGNGGAGRFLATQGFSGGVTIQVSVSGANPQTLCSGATGTALTVTETGQGTAAVTRQWGYRTSTGGAVTPIPGATAQSFTPAANSFSGPGTYFVVCTSTPDCGAATVSNEISVTVVATPTPGTITAPKTTVCTGESLTLALSGNSIAPQWQSAPLTGSFSNIPNATGNTLTASPSQTTRYRVLAASGACSDSSAALTITVNNAPAAPVLSATVTAFCPGDSTQVCAPSGFSSYQWSTGASTSCVVTRQAGSFTVSVTDNNGCSAASLPVSISLFQAPTATISISGDTLLASAATSYQWYKDGNPINGATAGFYVPSQTGSYTVEISDANGCSALSAPENIMITGLDKNATAGRMELLPNPTTGLVALRWTGFEGDEIFISVFNSVGALVNSTRWMNENAVTKSLDFSSLSKGVYSVSARCGEHSRITRLILY